MNCAPSSGLLFPIGDTAVTCEAADAGNNAASAIFVVTVRGAKEQVAQLIGEVVDSTRLPAAVKAQLTASLRSLVAGFDPDDPARHRAACLTLKLFVSVVRYVAPPAQAAESTTDANRIRTVLAC